MQSGRADWADRHGALVYQTSVIQMDVLASHGSQKHFEVLMSSKEYLREYSKELNMEMRRISWLMACTLVVFLAGQSRANAAAVLLLSTGNAAEDAAVQNTLVNQGHQS